MSVTIEREYELGRCTDTRRRRRCLQHRPGALSLIPCYCRHLPSLRVVLLMAFHAFHRSLLAFDVFSLMAINAGPRSSGRVVKRSLKLGLHGRGCCLSVAVTARLLGSLERFFRLGSVVAGFALAAGALRRVELMVEPHPTRRRGQDVRVLRLLLIISGRRDLDHADEECNQRDHNRES